MSTTLSSPVVTAIQPTCNTTHRPKVVQDARCRFHWAAALFDLPNIEIWQGPDGTPQYSVKLDYPKLIERIRNHGVVPRVVEAKAYGTFTQVSFDKARYLERGAGIEVRRWHKDCDPLMHADAVIYADNGFRVISFVTSDIDVTPFMAFFRSRNVKVEVWGWEHKASGQLKDAVDEFVPLTRDLIVGEKPWRNSESRPAA